MKDNKLPTKAFQDLMPNNNCFGCGPDNEQGLRIKSYWSGDNEAVCRFHPAAHHSAGPDIYLNGGIISTLIDCHSVCTAVAKAYQLAGRQIGEGDLIWYVTGGLNVTFKRPVAIRSELLLTAAVVEIKEKKMTIHCSLVSNNQECAVGEVVAVRVPGEWLSGE